MTTKMTNISELTETIITQVKSRKLSESLLVAISGIDGSGKSYLSQQISHQLNQSQFNTVLVNIDLWHYPSSIRFANTNPGEHFYKNAFRFEELFDLFINPLKKNQAINVEVNLLNFLGDFYYPHRFVYQNVDVILLEGIFILKQELRENYDLSFWIESSFQTALKRAIQRNQEGLSEQKIIRDYQNIYFSAQKFHFAQDNPTSFVDGIFINEFDCYE